MAINVQFAKGISIPTTSNLVTGGLYFNTSNKNIYFNNEGTIVTFQGTDTTTATKLGSTTKGSASKPIYLSSGTATECSTYAGGTAVTLNGSSKAGATASFYAPTTGSSCKTTWWDQDLAGRYKNHCFYKPDPGVCKQLH